MPLRHPTQTARFLRLHQPPDFGELFGEQVEHVVETEHAGQFPLLVDDRNSTERPAPHHTQRILGDAPHLDGNYTIFGRVESGWEAVEAIERAPVKYDSNEPAVEILIQSARTVRPDVQVTEK